MSLPEAHYLSLLNGDFLGKNNVLRMVREFARYSNIQQGYYMEFGIMNGTFAIAAYRQLRGYVTDIYGFDSFAGHPEQKAEDKVHAEYAPYFREGNYKAVSVDFCRTAIHAETMLPPENIHLTPGFFSDTLPKFDIGQLKTKGFPICVMVDCDLYSSAADVFRFLTPILETGTWLLLDDYWCYRGDPKLGVRRAFDEWVKDNGRVGVSFYCNFNAYSRAYICHTL
jgi:O-methyltransferase